MTLRGWHRVLLGVYGVKLVVLLSHHHVLDLVDLHIDGGSQLFFGHQLFLDTYDLVNCAFEISELRGQPVERSPHQPQVSLVFAFGLQGHCLFFIFNRRLELWDLQIRLTMLVNVDAAIFLGT
jgi:hypothetical protein